MRTTHIGPSIPPSRRTVFLKSFDRSPGTPAEFHRPAARISGAIAMYALWIACAAASFWVVRLDNLVQRVEA